MNSVVDSVEILSLGILGDAHLILIGTSLSVHTLFEVGLGIPYHVTEELGKLGSVLSLLPSVALESIGNFGITLAVSLTGHSEIHTNLSTLTHEMIVEILLHLVVYILGYTELMLSDEFKKCSLIKFFEF